MPLVFVTDAPTLWESDYADIVGMQYEFPEQYRSYVLPGERFIYYRGSRGRAAVGYFGEGVVGDIRPSARPAHLIAKIHDVLLYDEAVEIKDAAGNYWETGSTRGTNWANGVRRISDEVFEAITGAAGGVHPKINLPVPVWQTPDPAHASAMELYAVSVAMSLLADEFGAAHVREMPVNNPGFDIEVSRPSGPLHVEVKGTILPAPVFHLSEGQRKHAELLGDRFRLVVVYQIDVKQRTPGAELPGTDQYGQSDAPARQLDRCADGLDLSRAAANGGDDRGSHVGRRLVLPEAQHVPAGCGE